MGLVLFFAAWVDAQVPQLGHDDWPVREAAAARLDWFLPALFLPRDSADPEVRHRLRSLRTRNLKWLDWAYVERVLHARDYRAWLVACVLEGEPRGFTLQEVFGELHTDPAKARAYFEATTGSRSVPHWCAGLFIPHEFNTWLEHRQAYRDRRAPMPRELP